MRRIDPRDLAHSAAVAYGQALEEMHRARASLEAAYQTADAGQIGRAKRVMEAVTVVADSRWETLNRATAAVVEAGP